MILGCQKTDADASDPQAETAHPDTRFWHTDYTPIQVEGLHVKPRGVHRSVYAVQTVEDRELELRRVVERVHVSLYTYIYSLCVRSVCLDEPLHVSLYTYIYIYICACVFICIYIYIYMYICIYAYVYVYV